MLTRADDKRGELIPPPCIICGNVVGNRTHVAREMMCGTKEPFRYLECCACECLQLLDIPHDLSPYYPRDYYSFAEPDDVVTPRIKFWLKSLRLNAWLGGNNWLGILLLKKYGAPLAVDWIRSLGVRANTPILEVGCGSGHLLHQLKYAGFRSVSGVDPFIERDRCYANGVTISRATVENISGKYGLIIAHHSFEHLPDPVSGLTHMRDLLGPDGKMLITIPLAGTFAWKHYGVNWAALDAPRHLVLQSVKSMDLLARRCGLEVVSVKFNSTAFQFWASEQYVNDIPLLSDISYAKNPTKSMFHRAQIEEFEDRARILNDQQNGDEASFVLKRAE